MRLTIRDAQHADHRFIAASWSTSWGRPPQANPMTPMAWRTAVWSSVPPLLDRPGVRALVAADPSETDRVADLFGFIVWEPAAAVRTRDPRSRVPVFTYRRVRPEEPALNALPLVWYCNIKTGYRFDNASTLNARIATALFREAGVDPRSPFPFVCHTPFVDRLREAGKLQAAEWRPELGRVDTNPED